LTLYISQIWCTHFQSINIIQFVLGELLTIDQLLDPAEERDIGNFSAFESGDKAIADEVCHEIAAVNGEVIDVDSDSDGDGDLQFSLNLSIQLLESEVASDKMRAQIGSFAQ
jgi:hypothetical protein